MSPDMRLRVLSSLRDSSVVDHFVLRSDGIGWDRVVTAGGSDLLFGFRVDDLLEQDGDGLGPKFLPGDDGGNGAVFGEGVTSYNRPVEA
ncbi:hypothetical protein J5N97_000503 [Dioscorea zingiberensis]|uniref:Uncharacterized protein n=1 Tax=Dioscorea zingiberensis TaxID=325984 RepID=A0A9D5H1M0_9LILI|nr:hypothetical protein J5N97_000503 [Dioscorea zingiberensis]